MPGNGGMKSEAYSGDEVRGLPQCVNYHEIPAPHAPRLCCGQAQRDRTDDLKKLRFRRRWAGWWLGIILATHYAVLVYVCWRMFRDNRHSISGAWLGVLVTFGMLATYWVLAAMLNWRTAVVQPSGIRVKLFPLPTGSGHFITREVVALCFARSDHETTEDGLEANHHFTIGTQTTAGTQVDIPSRFATEDDAMAAAHTVGLILNSNLAYTPVRVELVRANGTNFPSLKRQLVLWVVITVIAVLVGAVCGMIADTAI